MPVVQKDHQINVSVINQNVEICQQLKNIEKNSNHLSLTTVNLIFPLNKKLFEWKLCKLNFYFI